MFAVTICDRKLYDNILVMNSFKFQTHEYYHRHKGADWYWAVWIIAISATATSIILNNILLAILIVIGTFLLTIYAAREPHEHHVEINDSGVTVDKYHYTYGNLESFWIEHFERPRLLIKTNRMLHPHLLIPVADLTEEEKADLRDFLATKIPEIEQSEPLFEQIMEYIGF